MKIISQKGMTLVEVLISILLLSIVLAGGISFYSNSTSVMTTAMNKKIAMEMATQAMEQMRDAGYSALPNCVTSPTLCGAWLPNPATAVTFNNGNFSFSAQQQRRVADIDGTSPNSNKKVEIQVCWPTCGSATSKAINLATYMAP